MGTILENLRPIYNAMRRSRTVRTCFEFHYQNTSFDVVFVVNGVTDKLLFFPRGSDLVFEFKVCPGFKVDTAIPLPAYNALRELLVPERDPTHPLLLRSFIQEFGRAVAAPPVPEAEHSSMRHNPRVRMTVARPGHPSS